MQPNGSALVRWSAHSSISFIPRFSDIFTYFISIIHFKNRFILLIFCVFSFNLISVFVLLRTFIFHRTSCWANYIRSQIHGHLWTTHSSWAQALLFVKEIWFDIFLSDSICFHTKKHIFITIWRLLCTQLLLSIRVKLDVLQIYFDDRAFGWDLNLLIVIFSDHHFLYFGYSLAYRKHFRLWYNLSWLKLAHIFNLYIYYRKQTKI